MFAYGTGWSTHWKGITVSLVLFEHKVTSAMRWFSLFVDPLKPRGAIAGQNRSSRLVQTLLLNDVDVTHPIC